MLKIDKKNLRRADPYTQIKLKDQIMWKIYVWLNLQLLIQQATVKNLQKKNAKKEMQLNTQHCNTTGNPLPKYLFIGLLDGKNCIMTLRTKPLVIRIHKFKEQQESHEYYYCEMLLHVKGLR